MELKFLPLQPEHLDRVLEIEKLSFPQPWTRGIFEREISLPISHFFVAELNGEIAGYGGYWHVLDEAHLTSLAVHPACRSKGIGRKILDFLVSSMANQGINRVMLEVREHNRPARELYDSAGFRVTGMRPKYYNDENAILMEKELTVKA